MYTIDIKLEMQANNGDNNLFSCIYTCIPTMRALKV